MKVGKAKNPNSRLKELSTAASSQLVLLGFVEQDIESMLHRKHAADRVSGEWFVVSEAIAGEVRKQTGQIVVPDTTPHFSPADVYRIIFQSIRRMYATGGSWIAEGPYDESTDCEIVEDSFDESYDETVAAYLGERPASSSEEPEDIDLMGEWDILEVGYEAFRRAGAVGILWCEGIITVVVKSDGRFSAKALIAEAAADYFWDFDAAGIVLNVLIVEDETGEVELVNLHHVRHYGIDGPDFLEEFDLEKRITEFLSEEAEEKVAPRPAKGAK